MAQRQNKRKHLAVFGVTWFVEEVLCHNPNLCVLKRGAGDNLLNKPWLDPGY